MTVVDIQILDGHTRGGERCHEQIARDIFCGYPIVKHFLSPQDMLILGQDVSLSLTTQSQDKEHQYAKSLPA